MSKILAIFNDFKSGSPVRPGQREKCIVLRFQETHTAFSPAMIPYDLLGEFDVAILSPLLDLVFERPGIYSLAR